MQVVNLHTNKVARIIGKVENTERFLRIALYQGGYSSKKVKKLPAAAANVNEQREPLTDPTLLCCAFKKHRLYLFRCIYKPKRSCSWLMYVLWASLDTTYSHGDNKTVLLLFYCCSCITSANSGHT